MSRNELVAHKETGSFSIASDIYRYRLLREGMGLYVDCDVYCLRPLPEVDYIFGWETDKYLGNAILKAPADSGLLRDLNKAAGDPYFVPQWGSKISRRYLSARKFLGMPKSVAEMKWGTLGPHLLTHLVEKHALHQHVLPIDAFYPLHYSLTPLLFESGLTVSDLVTSRTYALHLCQSQHGRRSVPPRTPLAEIIGA